ncbi:relaxase/mobilization nuclease domain-containing protein [Methylobacterium sp. A52T]
MIITIQTHGRTRRDTAALLAHLQKSTSDQVVELIRIKGSPACEMAEAFADFERIRDGSAAKVALQHLTVNPGRPWTAAQRDEAVERILRVLGAEDHGHVLIAHRNKPRARGKSGDEHFHLVIAHVGPNLRALDLSCSYAELEAVRASIEFDFGEPLTPSRRSAAIAKRLRRDALNAVAERVEAAALLRALPRSGMTSGIRARLERLGIAAPLARARIMEAYALDEAGFEAALSRAGLTCAPGDQAASTWIVRQGDVLIGALDRLVTRPRSAVAARMLTIAEAARNRAESRFVPVEVGEPDSVRDGAKVPETFARTVDKIADTEMLHLSRPDALSPLEDWRARLKEDLARNRAALEKARQRSPIPLDRRFEEEGARAEYRAAQAARKSAEGLVETHAEQRPSPRWFGGLFRRKRRPNPELVKATAELLSAYNREANAQKVCDQIASIRKAEAAAYALRMKIENADFGPVEDHAEHQISLLEDALAVLEHEPWRADLGAEAICDGVRRLRNADRLIEESYPDDDAKPANDPVSPRPLVQQSSDESSVINAQQHATAPSYP